MIHSVKGLKIGDTFNEGGVNFIVTSFPTRSSVCGKNQNPTSGEPNGCKVARSKVNFYKDHETDNIINE